MQLSDVQDFFEAYWPWMLGVLIILIIIIGILYARKRIRGVRCTSTARLEGKTVVVTGSNSGIGKEAARDFYRRGARVILACRNVDKANEAARDIESISDSKGTLVVHRLDLTDLKSVSEFAQKILATETRIDILVNNAGLVAAKQTTVDGFDMLFQANHLGHFLLTNLLLDKIKASAPARIVNVSSVVHQLGEMHWDDLNLNAEGAYKPFKAYYQSKLANVLFTKELAKRIEGTGVTTYSLHPGVIHSGFQRNNSDVFPEILGRLISEMTRLFMKNVVQGAQTTIHCSVCEKAAHQTGLYYDDCKPKQPSKRARDIPSARLLWQMSAEMVKLDEELAVLDNKIPKI